LTLNVPRLSIAQLFATISSSFGTSRIVSIYLIHISIIWMRRGCKEEVGGNYKH
jgi:hypothetical protein